MELKNTEKLEKSQVKLTISVDAAEFEKGLEKAYRQNVGRINMPGFRKGKAPRKMIERMYGESFFYEDAVNACYPEAYRAAVEQADLDTVGRADVDITEISRDGFTFEATVDVRPVAEIGTYKGLKAETTPITVSDEEIDAEIDRLRTRNARIETVERAAANGDTVIMDYAGFCHDKQFDGGTADNQPLELGSGNFIPGFEEQLIGAVAGDERDVNVTFPDPYHSDELAGQPAVFKVKIHEVKTRILPVLDDEFAKDVSECDTLDAFKAQIKSQKEHDRAHELDHVIEGQLIDGLLTDFKAEIPESMVETATEHLLEDFNYQLMSQGVDLQTYMNVTGMDREKLVESFREQANRNVKANLALSRVADLEKIDITEEQLDERLAKMAADYKVDAAKIREMVSPKTLKRDMRVEAALKIVRDSAVITEAKPEKKAAKKPAAKKEAAADTAEEKPAKKAPAKKPAAKKEGETAPAAKKTTKKSAE